MSRKQKLTVTFAAVLMLIGTALAFSNISLTLGTSPNFDFGAQYGGSQSATIQIHTFTVSPGQTIPWHHHKAVSYVVLERGSLTETHYDKNLGHCVSEEVTAGAGFVEQPGEVHTITNAGSGAAIVSWATAFPSSDGLVEIAPQFTLGGIYFDDAVNCN